MQSYRINPRIVHTHARVARVSLADCCALGGKGTGGLKTPGYSKTVLRTETQRLRRTSYRSVFAIAWAIVRFSIYGGMVFRIILL